MTLNLGDLPVDTTIFIPFGSFGADGESITLTGLVLGDIKIYKDGSITQRSSTAGFALLDTDGIDFDGLVGLHGISIDLSDNTDAGFYAVDSSYMVAIDAVTINTQTVRFWAAEFTIEIANGAIARIKALQLVATETRLAELDAANIPADIDAIPTTAMRGTDSAALASVATEARLAELDAANIPADIDAIPTTAMRGTDSAALASAITAGGPTLAEMTAEHDVLEGEHVVIAAAVAAIPTTAMRGTDNAALASVATEARLAELDPANLPADIDGIKLKTDNLPTSPQRGQAYLVEVLMVDSSDVPLTGLTVAGFVSKDGGAFSLMTNAVAEIANGVYKVLATTTEMTADNLVFVFTAAGAAQSTVIGSTSS